MNVGATFLTLEIGDDPEAIRDYAQAVESLGYHHILALEHILGFRTPSASRVGQLDATSPFHEPFVLFGYLAAVTRRIELTTGVMVIPLRQTELVAKQAAEVDFLSGGRLRLGIGVGWVPAEFDAMRMDYHTRGARSAEQISVLRALWTEPFVTFRGRWHHLEDAGISPRPVQRPIPIWIGGKSGATLKRVAQLGDGWLTLRPPDEESRAMIERLRQYARDAGRAPEEIGIEIPLSIGEVPELKWANYVGQWNQLGATHVFVNTMGVGSRSVEDHIDALARVKSVLRAAGLT